MIGLNIFSPQKDMTNPQELKSNTPLEEEPSVLTESTGKCSSWFEKAYTSFLTAAESLLKWLYIGIEWPRDINQGMFTLRTVTRFDQHLVNDVSVLNDCDVLRVKFMGVQARTPSLGGLCVFVNNKSKAARPYKG